MLSQRAAAILGAGLFLVAGLGQPAGATAPDFPKFRHGLWQFRHTITLNGRSVDRTQTVCTDPGTLVRGTLTPMDMGPCKSRPVEHRGNQYILVTRCGPASITRIVFTVAGDSAYEEVNDSRQGAMATRQTTVARRIHACK